MSKYAIMDFNTGMFTCTKCGESFNFEKCLPVPVNMGIAMMESWTKDHKHDDTRTCGNCGDSSLCEQEDVALNAPACDVWSGKEEDDGSDSDI